MQIGVLALQGDFRAHVDVFSKLGAHAIEVRLPEQLIGLDGLVIPGGESTSIGKLAAKYDLIDPIRAMAGEHKALWGTCAGAIFLSKDARSRQPLLHLMDIVVQRNAFGRQVDSFELGIDISSLTHESECPHLFNAIFIRAPIIESVGLGVEAVASLPTGEVVAAQQGKLFATVFHPELTQDDRLHRHFLSMVSADY